MNKLYNDTAVQAIANAIRAKNGSSDTYTIAEMSTALNDLSYYVKPTISNVALATFEADGLPLNSLKVSVEAKQEGSGTPSPENVRPISGWSEVNVSDVGKNLLNVDAETLNSYVTGNYTISGGSNNKGVIIPLRHNTDYTFKWVREAISSTDDCQLLLTYDKPTYGVTGFREYVISASGNSVTFNSSNANWVYIKLAEITKTDFDTTLANSQLEFGSTATDYEPYINQTTTISLPQTVYGAEVDVVNGVLKITDGYIASYNGEVLPSTWISSMDVYAEGTSPTTGAEVCYELANPIIINLTPTLIKSLNGQNNLSVDSGDVIELEYFKEV